MIHTQSLANRRISEMDRFLETYKSPKQTQYEMENPSRPVTGRDWIRDHVSSTEEKSRTRRLHWKILSNT